MEVFLGFVIFLSFHCFSVVLCEKCSATRKVCTSTLHPDVIPENMTSVNLLYTTAVGPHDTLHYVIGTYGFPGVLVAKTDNDAVLQVNWKRFFSKNITETARSLNFTKTPQYSYGIQFLHLIEYQDSEDSANLSNANPNTTYKYSLASGIPWANSTAESRFKDNQIVLKIQENYTDMETGRKVAFMPGGSLSFNIQISNCSSRAADMPHLQSTDNTTLAEVVIDHLQPQFEESRYAFEFMFVTSASSTGKGRINLHVHKTIDDEFTPGVFQTIDLQDESDLSSSFLQWKPVCYKSSNKAMKTATKVKDYPLEDSTELLPNVQGRRSLLYSCMGDDMYRDGNYHIKGLNVSFGLSQDKFYSHTYYTSWSFTLGNGPVPIEKSPLYLWVVLPVPMACGVILVACLGYNCIKNKWCCPGSPKKDSKKESEKDS